MAIWTIFKQESWHPVCVTMFVNAFAICVEEFLGIHFVCVCVSDMKGCES